MAGRADNGVSDLPQRVRPLKITVVGDGTVGKTCLLYSYTMDTFPEEYVPIVFEHYAKALVVDDVGFALTLWDTAGEEEYEKLRPLSYPETDCFILCYAVNNRASFANIETKWIPELKYHCPKAAILLVGTKMDLKDGDIITELERKKLKSRIKANGFLQCSAKTREGLSEVYVEAVRAVMKNSGSKHNFCRFI